MEVALDGDRADALEAGQGVGGVAVGLGQQGLGDVEQVEADRRVLALPGDEGDQAGLQVAGARAEGDDVHAALAGGAVDGLGGAVQGHDPVRVGVVRLRGDLQPVEGARVIIIKVCLLDGAALALEDLEHAVELGHRGEARGVPGIGLGGLGLVLGDQLLGEGQLADGDQAAEGGGGGVAAGFDVLDGRSSWIAQAIDAAVGHEAGALYVIDEFMDRYGYDDQAAALKTLLDERWSKWGPTIQVFWQDVDEEDEED